MRSLKSILYLKKAAITKVAIAVGITLSLSSCLKNKNSEYVELPVAALSIFHASPGTEPFNVAIGQTIITTDSYNRVLFEYSKALSYVRVNPGQRTVSLVKKNTIDTLKTGRFNISDNKYYSLFVVDAAPNPNFLIVEDTIVTPANGKARVRFVNLSPDAGALNLVAKSGTTTDSLLFSNAAYKTATRFTDLSGTKAYTFEIKNGATSVATSASVEIKSGKTYTIWAKGLSTATVDSLKTSVKVNQQL